VVGGPLVNGCTARVVDWAAFFCEYSMFVPPAEGRSHLIPGNNVVYTRSALEDARDLIDAGAWDMALHARLEELGRGRWMEPAMTLVHQRSFGFREFLVLRFHFARAFAGARVPARQRWRRMALAAGTPLLPAVLLARIARVVVGRGYHGSALARSLPVLMIFLTSGAIGELCGYVLGAGASGRKVE
jgi:hypothetical protein